MTRTIPILALTLLLLSCTDGPQTRDTPFPVPGSSGPPLSSKVEILEDAPDSFTQDLTGPDDATVGKRTIQPPHPAVKAPEATPRMPLGKPSEALQTKIDSHFSTLRGHHSLYIATDKPLYRPGESIWMRAWTLTRGTLLPGTPYGASFELISPKGAVVLQKQVQLNGKVLSADFLLPDNVPGGEYTLKVREMATGAVEERAIIVSNYEPPRIKKRLDFVQKAYGPGDEVSATLEIKRPTGEPLANKGLKATIRLDGQDLSPVAVKTNEHGGAIVRFPLPDKIDLGDGLLTVMVDDGGIIESISRRIPIVLKKVDFKMFPEGGDLVTGLPGRVYFEARNTMGKPADVKGRVLDDKGREVAQFASVRDGRGRFGFTPQRGRTYTAQITAPRGVEERFEVGKIAKTGCTLSSFDDLDGAQQAIRVSVRCTKAQTVTVTAMQREQLIDTARVKVPNGKPAIIHLQTKDPALASAQGMARVTVWGDKNTPLAERVVYRNRRNGLNIELEAHKPEYGPRDKVELTIKTTDNNGKPIPADVSLSVVDDTVISFADDKKGHFLSRTLLERGLPGTLEEPKFYFDLTEKASAEAMDMLMGTRGWRRFDWKPVFNPPPPPRPVRRNIILGLGGGGDIDDLLGAEAVDRMDAALADPQAAQPRRPQAEPPPPAKVAEKQEEKADKDREKDLDGLADEAPMAEERLKAEDDRRMPMEQAEMDKDWAGANKNVVGWAPVRIFPVPDHKPNYEGPRTDFRDTIFWTPQVLTDNSGLATVSFPTSDAITSFRVFAEGAGGGHIGRKESVIKSSLPFSMAVKLPLEVSTGDDLKLPLTLTNERDESLNVDIKAVFGDVLTYLGDPKLTLDIPAGSRRTLLFPVRVTGQRGDVEVSFSAQAGQLSDEFTRTMAVVPRGFPQVWSKAGNLEGKDSYDVDLGEALPGTVTATVKFYPSPVATMVSGLEGMLRQPGGCFEQASSTNYPNLMVMRYLKEHKVDKPALYARSGKLLDAGYQLLTGYESPEKGYEWFGQNPGHEALTAYGLMEFADMKAVYSNVDGAMIERTAAWLKSRRDGKGGFLRNAKALDSFGQASKQVTDAYIIYALTEGGFAKDFKDELKALAKASSSTQDPYILGLAANALLMAPGHKDAGLDAANRLAKMQDKEGGFTGADHSITRSGGINLSIETTALAVMAMLRSGDRNAEVRSAVEWLNNNRGGFGQWGATQATVLSLKAMTSYAAATSKTRNAGSITILINGEVAREMAYKKGHSDTIVLEGLGEHFGGGNNTLEIIHESSEAMPYSVVVESRSLIPATSPEAVIDLDTKLDGDTMSLGEVMRATVTITNTTQEGQPMTLARVGLPGGLTSQTWQLKELRDKGLIGFYETRSREVILYLRDMEPGEVVTVPLDLVATVPGTYEGPASSAYLYYTDEHKTWKTGLPLTVKARP